MRVCLIKLIGRRWDEEQYFIDIGLGFLGTALSKAGHEVRILDCMIERFSWRIFERFIQENPFDLYCLKVYSHGIISAIRSIDIIRKHNPQAIIGVGGPHPSGAVGETFMHIPGIDFAWQGEAEVGLPKLLEKLDVQSSKSKVQNQPFVSHFSPPILDDIPGIIYQNGNRIKANSPYFHEPLDDFGYPDCNLMNMGKYIKIPSVRYIGYHYVPVLTSRGCPMPCTHCEAWRLSGKRVRRHSIDYVIGWIKELKYKYGIDFFAFVDDSLTEDKQYFITLLEEIIRLDLKIHWDCAQNAIRFDNLDENILKLMKKSGCFYMSVAIESGSQSTLKAMSRRVNFDLAREKINLIKKYTNIIILGYFILGYPTEKWEDLKMTTRFSRKLPLDGVDYFLFTPHPGTEIYQQLQNEGKLAKIEWSNSHYFSASIPLEDVSLKKLNLYKRWAKIRFLCRFKYLTKIPLFNAPIKINWRDEIIRLLRGFVQNYIID